MARHLAVSWHWLMVQGLLCVLPCTALTTGTAQISESKDSLNFKALSEGGVTPFRPSIVCIGDGLTESAFHVSGRGWGALLAANYTRKVMQAFPGLSQSVYCIVAKQQ